MSEGPLCVILWDPMVNPGTLNKASMFMAGKISHVVCADPRLSSRHSDSAVPFTVPRVRRSQAGKGPFARGGAA